MKINSELYCQAGKIILSAGIPVNYTAYDYFCLAVCMVAEDARLLSQLTKSVYPDIAKMRGSNSKNVQRNMYTALEAAWTKRQESMQQLPSRFCGTTFTQRPAPGQCIGIAVMILALERGKSF